MNHMIKSSHRQRLKSPLGLALSLLNSFAASPLVERLGLRDPAKKLLYQGLRASVKVGSIAQSQFRPLKQLLPDQKLTKETPKNLFDLTLTEEQEMVRDMILSFSRQNLRPIARKVDETGDVPKEFLTQCQEAGIVLTGIPAAIDGAGTTRSPVSTMLLCEDLAMGDMALALVALAPLGFVNALTDFASHDQQAQYLPAFTGERYVAASLALMEPGLRFKPAQLQTRAKRTADGYRLDGVKCMVPIGQQAEAFIVFAELEGQGPLGFIVEAHTEGLVTLPEKYMGLKGAGLSRLELNGVQVSKKAILGEDEVVYDHQKMVDLCRIGICALAVGTGQAVLDYVIQYCNERVAFAEPISHRQAVAFMIADIAIELESMRLLTYRAASRAEQGLDFHREAYLAHVLCAEKSMEIGTNGVQLLGGHGYVCEHPVELWYRQLRATGILEGSVMV